MDLEMWIFGSFHWKAILYSQNTGGMLEKKLAKALFTLDDKNMNNLSSSDNILWQHVDCLDDTTFLLAIFT